MRNWKLITAGLVAGVAIAGAVFAQQKGGVKPLTAQDYAEINQLYIHYNWGIDTHAENGMAWAKTFTPDGEFIIGNNKTVGREKLAEFAKLKPGAPPANAPHHYATNIKIDPSPEGARGGAYFFNVTTPEGKQPASITTTGTYEDIIVKTSDGWRFKQRKFYSNALPPSMIQSGSSN